MSNDQTLPTEQLTAVWVKNLMSDRDEENLCLGRITLGTVQRSGTGLNWLYYLPRDPSSREAATCEDAKAALLEALQPTDKVRPALRAQLQPTTVQNS